jgi:DNA polymerase
MLDADPRSAAQALLDWWALSGVDVAEARSLLRAAPTAPPVRPASAPIKRATPGVAPPAALPAGVEDARAAAAKASSLAELRAALDAFDGCPLRKTAHSTVFSDGVEDAEVMLVGEAPGRDEDEIGKPFVGRSGQLLDRMFGAIGLSRKTNLFISNVIFWRPPGNRPPTQGEIAACLPFIRRAIELKNPKLLIFIGGMAAQTLLAKEAGVMRLRNKRLSYDSPNGTKFNASVMLHPAYLLRRPQEKRLAWADLLHAETWADELGIARSPRP